MRLSLHQAGCRGRGGKRTLGERRSDSTARALLSTRVSGRGTSIMSVMSIGAYGFEDVGCPDSFRSGEAFGLDLHQASESAVGRLRQYSGERIVDDKADVRKPRSARAGRKTRTSSTCLGEIGRLCGVGWPLMISRLCRCPRLRLHRLRIVPSETSSSFMRRTARTLAQSLLRSVPDA